MKDLKSKGATLEQTVKAMGRQSSEPAARLGVHDAEASNAFREYFLDVFVKRAYREIDGPLGDLPDGLPQ